MQPVVSRRLARHILLGVLSSLCGVAAAHEQVAHATSRAAVASSAPVLRLSSDVPPVAARYAVSVTSRGKAIATAHRHVWHFYRQPQRIAVHKGAIDEIWHRDAQGQISFERVFHDEARAVNYSAGELFTLGVHADWAALASFVDLSALRVVSRTGSADAQRMRLTGTIGGDRLQVEWLTALQLPARLTRTDRAGKVTDIRLVQHAAAAPADWPLPDQRSADYLRLDAADFGDMGYETVVRLSEALDVRLGWRQPHAHD
jgi:hypothetical protein